MHWLLALSFIGFSIVGHTRGSMRWMERSGAEQERSGVERSRSGAEWSGVERSGAEWSGVERSQPSLPSGGSGAELSGAVLSQCTLSLPTYPH